MQMNRRSMMRVTVLTGGALAVGGPALFLQGCGSTKQLSKWTSVFIGALKDVSPILSDIGAGGTKVTALITKALPIAEQLKKAFDNNDNASAFQLLNSLIDPQTGIIVEIAEAVTKLTDERKKFIQGILAIGMVALRLIAAQIESDVPATAKASARAVNASAAASVERAAHKQTFDLVFNDVRF